MRVFAIYLATCSLFCTCLALPEAHKQMTSDELQSVFNVDNHDSVPDYELVQLSHHGILHSVHKRSINNFYDVDAKQSYHVKKDLSKSPYYSELKLAMSQHGANSLSDQNFSEKLKNLDVSQIKEHNVSFSAFGEVLNLTLKPTEGLFKDGPKSLRVWTVRSDPNATQGVQYEEVNDDTENPEHIGEIFQDEKNMAAILMRRHIETGDLIMEGSIGHELVIKPLPKKLNLDDDGVHHVIYKRLASLNDQFSDFAFMEPDRVEKRYRERRSAETVSQHQNAAAIDDETVSSLREDDKGSTTTPSKERSKREAPYIIYPEILVIVDYDGYRLHGGDNLQVKRYFVSFWNGVDLRYRLLKGPRIRISIAGIIISRGRDATPYLERNRVGRDAIDSAAALTDMGKYLFRERRLPVYDIAVAITKYDMCRRRKGGRCTKGTAGFAYVGGACVVNKRLEKVNSVAIIEDTGGFSGIIVAAHEVGHLLGAVHDGSPPPSYLGGPGAEKCRWEDGYIMSDLRHTERGFRWSACTIQSFHHFLNGDTASCLHNAPHEDEALGRALPGTLLSLDAQCRRDRGTYACFKDDRVCAQLFCFDSLTGYCVAYRPAAEGSSCGSGLHCLDGRCVTQQQQNAIQNYGQDGGFSNLYRPVFNDEYDDIEDTTIVAPSSTPRPVKLKKRIYYRSTTQQTPSSTTSYDRSIDDYLNSFPMVTDSPSASPKTNKPFESLKSRYTTTTSIPAPSTTTVATTTTTNRATSINPFYFGFPKFTTTTSTNKPPTPQTQHINNWYHQASIEPAKPSFNSNSYSNNNNNNNNDWRTNTTPFSNNLYSLQTTKSTSTTLRPTSNPYTTDTYNSNNNYNNANMKYGTNTGQDLFFSSYLKKLKTTTRNPYNFNNLAEYYRTTTTTTVKPSPSYSSNFLGDNSNRSPLGLWFA